MNVNMLPGSKVQFEVVIPVDVFKKALDKAFEKKNQEVEVPGFRKGQAPREIYEAKYGKESLYPDALNEAMSETYYDFVNENNINVCGYPKVDLDEKNIDPEKPIHYFVTVSVYPVVKLGAYRDLAIEKARVVVTTKEVNEEINSTLEREAMLEKKAGDNPVIEKGDTAVFDFTGYVDDKEFEGGSAKDYSLEIGSGAFIPGFEEQMIGLKVGDKSDVKVKFPEDYHAENLKGKNAVFKIEVKEIKVKNVPVLNDEFVKGLKIEGVETVDQYKLHVKADLKSHKEEAAANEAKNKLYHTIIENATFELADDLIQDEADYSLKQAEGQAKQYGIDLQTLLSYTGGGSVEDFKKHLFEQAKDTLSLQFVLKEIAKEEKIEATAEEIEKKTKEIADQYKMTVEQVKQSVSDQALKEEIETQKAYELIQSWNPFVAPKAKSVENKQE